MSAWYESSFGLDYLRLYPHRDLAEARANVGALLEWLPLPTGEPLLDLGCGAGRVLLALREHGFSRLVGLDLSLDLLRICAQELHRAGVADVSLYEADGQRPEAAADRVVLVHGDMRHIPYAGYFGTVLSIFTSFGYFESDDENEQVFHAAAGALRPGGTFVLDYLNREQVLAGLVPQDERRLADGSVVRNRRCVTPDGLRVEKRTEVVAADGTRREFLESVRMYGADEVLAMLARAGFVAPRLCGSFAGAEFGPGSERLIVITHMGDCR